MAKFIVPGIVCSTFIISCVLIINSSRVTCNCEKLNQSIVISPPDEKPCNDKNYLESVVSTNDTRKNLNGTTFSVMDCRLPDFATVHTDTLKFDGSMEVASFSVKAPFKIRIYMKNATHAFPLSIILTRNDSAWYHFKMEFKENHTEIYEKDVLIHTDKYRERIEDIFVKNINETKTLWKVHQISGKLSNKPFVGKPTTLTIPPQSSCIEFYVKLCENCQLEVFFDNETKIFTGNGTENSWQKHTFKQTSSENTNRILYRTKIGEDMEGFWFYDMTPCSSATRYRRQEKCACPESLWSKVLLVAIIVVDLLILVVMGIAVIVNKFKNKYENCLPFNY